MFFSKENKELRRRLNTPIAILGNLSPRQAHKMVPPISAKAFLAASDTLGTDWHVGFDMTLGESMWALQQTVIWRSGTYLGYEGVDAAARLMLFQYLNNRNIFASSDSSEISDEIRGISGVDAVLVTSALMNHPDNTRPSEIVGRLQIASDVIQSHSLEDALSMMHLIADYYDYARIRLILDYGVDTDLVRSLEEGSA